MHSILLRPHPDEADVLTAELWDLGTVGIIEEGLCLRAFFEDSADLDVFAQQFKGIVEEIRCEPENTAYRPSREDWEPLLIGNRFFIAPPWMDVPTPEGRLRIMLDEAGAFGTGRHETTQLALEYLEEVIQGGETIVDVGCGSGILMAAARMLGAGQLFGCDVDYLAIQNTVNAFGFSVFTGSADAIRSGIADVLLVNISARVIDLIAPELKRITKPAGTVLLSGFIHGSEPEQFAPEERRGRGDWLCLIGNRESILAPEATPGPALTHSKQWW